MMLCDLSSSSAFDELEINARLGAHRLNICIELSVCRMRANCTAS